MVIYHQERIDTPVYVCTNIDRWMGKSMENPKIRFLHADISWKNMTAQCTTLFPIQHVLKVESRPHQSSLHEIQPAFQVKTCFFFLLFFLYSMLSDDFQ